MPEVVWKTVTNQPGGGCRDCRRRSVATGVTLEKTRQFNKQCPKPSKWK